MSAFAGVHEDIARQGYAVTDEAALGLDGLAVMTAFASALAGDPRGAGKLHARDVVTYDRGHPLQWPQVAHADSIAHGGATDFSRMWLLSQQAGLDAARVALALVPEGLRRQQGRMSADYFRYAAGAQSEAHQDKFGDFAVIWVLGREGDGGESFLNGLDGHEVFYDALKPGRILVFRDEMFYHGVEAMRGGGSWRDVLIFITLRD